MNVNNAQRSTRAVTATLRATLQRHRLRCLWIASTMQAMSDTQGHTLCTYLSAALAKAHVDVQYAVTQCSGAQVELLRHELAQPWDVIILEGKESAWALPLCKAARDAHDTLLVYLSSARHTATEESKGAQAASRIALLQPEEQRLEREIMSHMDLVTLISVDAVQLPPLPTRTRSAASARNSPHQLILTPGYVGTQQPEATLACTTPRRIVLVGEFEHPDAQTQLQALLAVATPLLLQHQVGLDIMDAPLSLQQALRNDQASAAMRFYSRVEAPFTSRARLALVLDVGADLKQQLLKLIFGRIPVATLNTAAATLPAALRASMLCANSMDALLHTAVAHIDKLDTLNELQHQAYATAQSLFDWDSRGEQLKNTMQLLCR